MPLNRIDMVAWGVVFAVLCWCAHSIHCICGAIQSILDMFSSKDKVEESLCRHVIELQKDKGKLTDRVNEATEIIESLRTCLLDFDEGTIEPYKQYIDKAETFINKEEREVE